MMRPSSLAIGVLLATGIYLVATPDSVRVPTETSGLRERSVAPNFSVRESNGISVLPAPALAAAIQSPGSSGSVTWPPADNRTPASASEQGAIAGQGVSELAGAEKLAVKVQGYSELSGEYRVGQDGTLSVPVVGRLMVGNMSASDLETALARRVALLTSRETHVTVEVIDYRAIFVSGAVARPGSFSWRPGMTVLHALAMAGGASNQDDDTAIAGLKKAVAHQKRNLAALARLQAERADKQVIEVPAKLVGLVGVADAAEVVKAEQTALRSRHSALGAKRAALQRGTEMARKELVGLTAQAKRLESQLSTRRTYQTQIDSLKEKGIVRADRSMDEFARVADLEDRATTVAVATARIQATLAAMERDFVNLEYERVADLDQEIIKMGREIAQLDIDIESERIKYRRLTGSEVPTSMLSSDPAKKSAMKYKIVRRTAQGPVSLVADQLTDIRPDDILMVNLE